MIPVSEPRTPNLNPKPQTLRRMKLAFSSNAYMHFSIEDTIAKIADLGYTGIEILADALLAEAV